MLLLHCGGINSRKKKRPHCQRGRGVVMKNRGGCKNIDGNWSLTKSLDCQLPEPLAVIRSCILSLSALLLMRSGDMI